MGLPPGTKKAASRVTRPAAVSQKLRAFRRGKLMRVGADLRREDEVAEAGLRGDGHDEEEHERAVHGDEGEVFLREDGAVEGEAPVWPGEVEAHEEAEDGAEDEGDRAEEEIGEAEAAVVGGEYTAPDGAGPP